MEILLLLLHHRATFATFLGHDIGLSQYRVNVQAAVLEAAAVLVQGQELVQVLVLEPA
jgi:hypothetical protein